MERIATLYELTKAITSIGDFDELLIKISQETSKAFHATGCMIRLLEGDKLRVRSSIGFPPDTLEKDTTVTVGEGIAGRA
ncbi:MAG: hypothetical protein HGA78_11460, partial [Nitrospirales bacterium]|nr:hypothetical protein [Nitrospirales bacterium]